MDRDDFDGPPELALGLPGVFRDQLASGTWGPIVALAHPIYWKRFSDMLALPFLAALAFVPISTSEVVMK